MNVHPDLPVDATAERAGLFDKNVFKEAVRSWAKTLSVKPFQIRVQQMKKKWASCSSRGTVTFNEDLLMENEGFQGYVIVHELLHLRVPNHGKLFRSLMSLYLPDWEDRAKHSSAF